LDTVKEWQRLTEYYGGRVDEELLELAADFEGLTDVAQQVLRDELKKRHLPPPGSRDPRTSKKIGTPVWKHPAAYADPVAEPEPSDESASEYTWKVVLCECNEREDAADLMAALERAGIGSWYDGPNSPFSSLRYGPRVLVGADDLEAAQMVMQRPIPQDIHDQTRTPVLDFETPNCAKCGAADPLLESVDPSNTWFCENCGARWNEPLSASEEKTDQPEK
jgi:hypothetical protein